MITKIQSCVGIVGTIILMVVAGLVFSWGVTCLFTYWISILWSGSIVAFNWSWDFATGIWLVLILFRWVVVINNTGIKINN